MIQHHCLSCRIVTAHQHLHDCAHGIPETHLTGSERFVCTACDRTTFAHSAGVETFAFALDGHAMRRILA